MSVAYCAVCASNTEHTWGALADDLLALDWEALP